MPRSNNTALSSSSSSGYSASRSALPFSRSVTDFEVERSERVLSHKSPSYSRPPSRAVLSRTNSDYGSETMHQRSVSSLMVAKARPFSISGHIPLDSSSLTVFFRSGSGITHSLDFPIDVEPHATCEMDGFSDRESLFYPPDLSLTSTLELANHPILDAIRTALFPRLATEGKVASIIVTLPVRFRGGALTVHDFEGNEEKYYGRGGKPGDLEWTAFLADCDHEVETVHRGVRLTISYNVLLRTFGPSPSPSQSLMLPSDRFLDLISPILNMSRGQHIAFYLREQYGFSPADVLAESLVPHLKGGDALLYHSLRLYKLLPELRWAAGGYIWPVDSTVECGSFVRGSPHASHHPRSPLAHPMSPMAVSPMSPSGRHRRAYSGVPRSGFSLYRDSGSDSTDEDELEREHEAGALRNRVEDSGAILLAQAGITLLADETLGASDTVTKERVPYISAGGLDKLVINVLLVVYVP
ncbi:hypothetical protein DFH11DRAFT_1604082 [Phellopilus nigrolimitatus]|nr:hypothetical protein DFH11DRAFT_1604082 [Phellopilus nigrolimitatus]